MNRPQLISRERGFVLPIGMIMLLILSIIGIHAARDGVLQEKMASNFIDQEKSFQGAESGLRMVQHVTLHSSMEDILATSSFFSMVEGDMDDAPDMESIDMSDPSVGFIVAGINSGGSYFSDPVAMIEEMANSESLKVGKEPINLELAERYFRITVMANGDTGTSRTTLQGVAKR